MEAAAIYVTPEQTITSIIKYGSFAQFVPDLKCNGILLCHVTPLLTYEAFLFYLISVVQVSYMRISLCFGLSLYFEYGGAGDIFSFK